MMSPLFALGNLPIRVKVIFVMGMSLLLVLSINSGRYLTKLNLNELLGLALYEVFFGLTLAFGIYTAFAALSFGGRVLDFQMGFGIANLVDPVTKNQEPLLGTVLSLMGVLIFFLVDGHHILFKGIGYSIKYFPPGVMLHDMPFSEIISQFGVVFLYGIAIVAPAVFVIFLLDVALAIAARTMPQVNMFIVSIPLKIFIGLSMLAITINYISSLLNKVYQSIFVYWQGVLS